MARPDKVAAVKELSEGFRSSTGVVLTEYRGLSVKQLQDLRRALGENASYAVVKNSLTKLAAKEADLAVDESLLTGPTAIAFIKGDVVEATKGLRDFAKANSPLVIKGGVLDGQPLTLDEINKIADLESREALLAKLAGALTASLQNAASLFSAPLQQVARVANNLQDKAAQDPSILQGGAGAAPEESTAEDASSGEAASDNADAEQPTAEATTEG